MIGSTFSDKENPVAGLRQEARIFRDGKRREADEAAQVAAFFLTCGVDLSTALASTGVEREKLRLRLARLIERERLRGAMRHWSYDLNRHIALKQALQRLAGGKPADEKQKNGPPGRKRGGPSETDESAAGRRNGRPARIHLHDAGRRRPAAKLL